MAVEKYKNGHPTVAVLSDKDEVLLWTRHAKCTEEIEQVGRSNLAVAIQVCGAVIAAKRKRARAVVHCRGGIVVFSIGVGTAVAVVDTRAVVTTYEWVEVARKRIVASTVLECG